MPFQRRATPSRAQPRPTRGTKRREGPGGPSAGGVDARGRKRGREEDGRNGEMEAPADPARKVSLRRLSRVLAPSSDPAVSPLPGAPPGSSWLCSVSATPDAGSYCPPAPQPFLLLLFQGRLCTSRRKSRPSPLPPAGSGEGPSRPRSRAVSQSPRPRPHACQAPPLLAPLQTPSTGRISACAQVKRSRGGVEEAGGRGR